jgi:hypothetical protein
MKRGHGGIEYRRKGRKGRQGERIVERRKEEGTGRNRI